MESRSKQLAQIAATEQFKFKITPTSIDSKNSEIIDISSLMQSFKLFKRKQKTPINFSNIIITNNTDPLTYLFDWNRISSRSQKPKVETIFFAQSASFNFPICLLRPENMRDRTFTKFFGSNDIDFTASPLFSKKYWLEGKENAIIRTMFTQDIRSFLGKEKDWYLETIKQSIIITKHSTTIEADKILNFHRDCSLILKMLVK